MELVLMSGIPSVHDIVHLESCLGFFFAYCRHKQMKQQRHLSLMELELLIDITPFAAGNANFGMRLVPHVMANFAIVSGTNAVWRPLPTKVFIPWLSWVAF